MEAEEAEKRLKDYILNGIVPEILWAEEAYALAQGIGRRADAIRAAGFGSLFGSLKVLASDRQTLSVAKMFDRPQGRYPTRSIPATLAFLKAHADSWRVPERDVLHQTLIDAGVERKAVERLTKAELTRTIVSHHESELAALTPALADLRQSRDKIIAHNEAIERSSLRLPTWGAAVSAVDYAKDFVTAIGFGYLGTDLGMSGDFYLSYQAHRTAKQLRRLLETANIGE